jgi:hypothetical protein
MTIDEPLTHYLAFRRALGEKSRPAQAFSARSAGRSAREPPSPTSVPGASPHS